MAHSTSCRRATSNSGPATRGPCGLRTGGCIGRGVEDNQQGVVAGIYAVKALMEPGRPSRRSTSRCSSSPTRRPAASWASSTCSEEHAQMFRQEDLVIVPDGGEPDGSMIEVAEKGIAWIRFDPGASRATPACPRRGSTPTSPRAHADREAPGSLHQKFNARRTRSSTRRSPPSSRRRRRRTSPT